MTGGAFEIEVATLRAALKDMVDVVEARNTIPVLSNVLLDVTPTSLFITGTDLDMWIERHVALTKADSFTCTVEAAILRRIADKLPADADARVKLDRGKVTISAGRARFSLPTLPSDDFPSPTAPDWDAEFEMPALTLNGAIGRVMHAVSTEEVRYYLNGIYMHADGSADLRCATTDGKRLARVALAKPDGAETLPGVIIPRKVAKLLSGLLDRHDGTVDVRVSARQLRFEIGDTVLTGKTVDGQFPDYTRVIPSSHTSKAVLDREQLATAVGRVTTIATDKTKVVRFDFIGTTLRMSVNSPEKGEAVEEMPCAWSGPQLTVGFNSRYLLDTLGQLTADTVEGLFGDPAAASLWRDREDAPAVFVVMPTRV